MCTSALRFAAGRAPAMMRIVPCTRNATPTMQLAVLALLLRTAPASAAGAGLPGPGGSCYMQPKASGWNYKFAPGNVFPTDAMHPHGLRLTENSAQCCTLCQSLKNCTFFTYSAGGTVAKPTCYTSSHLGPGGCCFLKTDKGGAGAKGCPTCTSGSTKPLAPIPAPPPPPAPKFIPASDPACWYTGRTRTNADGSRSFDWEGTQLWLNVEGASYVKMVSGPHSAQLLAAAPRLSPLPVATYTGDQCHERHGRSLLHRGE